MGGVGIAARCGGYHAGMQPIARTLLMSLILIVPAGAALAQTPAPVAAAAPSVAGANPVVEAGCINCHGASPRGDAGRLQPASRYAERFASAEAVNQFVARLRADQGIVAHRQITETQGRQIADWLSKPAAQPVR